MLSKKAAVELINDQLWPALKQDQENLQRIDNWARWTHDKPHAPRQSSREYKELTGRSWTPWGSLTVTVVAQECYVDGYRRDREGTNLPVWDIWQANGMDARQVAVHRAALAYGLSYVTVLPGQDDITGEPVPAIRGVSPREMTAFYVNPADDDWPAYAMRTQRAIVKGNPGLVIKLYDDEAVHWLQCDNSGSGMTYVEFQEHGVGVCPVVRFANMLDLEGRSDGEIEPIIPVLGRIDQTTFDRLVVQRFSSWVVRTIAGMAKPDDADEAEAEKLRLRVEDLLVANDPDTKFGSLPATPLDGFISAFESDVRALAAVSQTPATEMLGQIANLSAEALAAAEASKGRKVAERRQAFGESWEQVLRLAAHISGDAEGAQDRSAQVRWRDTEFRALAQVADALGKMATMLQVPVEMLWERLPNWTDQDTERAKTLNAQGGSLDSLMNELANGQTSQGETDTAALKASADAFGILVRSGVDPDEAAARAGLPGMKMTGAVPVSLRQPETEADGLEPK